MVTFVVSDLHGCYNEFLEMLELIKFKDTDKMIVLGDVIDRNWGGVKLLHHIRNFKEVYNE